ncbi:MAG: prepilin-type N-terminal cleavage/methylation domain-containing protein [Desulfatiglandaceae bacterium]
MKKSRSSLNYSAGFTLIELLMVFIIIGALASIAIPHYAVYREKALESQCKANRYHIEMEEYAYFAEKNKPNLKIDNKYSCPSGGIYAWLVMDPLDPNYPQVGCSRHFTGSVPIEEASTEEPSTTPETPTEETPEAPAPPVEDISPVDLIKGLIDSTVNLNLSNNIKNSLLSSLKQAIDSIEKEKTSQAIKDVDKFIETVNKNKEKKIKSEEADVLIAEGNKILNLLE